MRFGITMFPTDLSIGPVQLGREAEARGLDSLWFPEHTHIPTSRRTPAPAGEPLAEEYKRSLDFAATASFAPPSFHGTASPYRPALPDRRG